MKYEECSHTLLKAFSGIIDPSHEGVVIEVGVGTFCYYFVDFAERGFRTLAVEPLPLPHLLAACRERGVELETACVSDIDGLVNIYLGEYKGCPNSNLSSLHPDWFGGSTEVRQVPSVRLTSLLAKYGVDKITILKLDTKGSESTIIECLKEIPSNTLPHIIQFEYGGGGTKRSQRGGWMPKYFANTCQSLQTLQSLGYEWLLLVERDLPVVGSFWLSELQDFAAIFHPLSHVGNAIICKDGSLQQHFDIVALCKPHMDYPQSLVTNLLHLGTEESTHSFKWVLPYVIAQQYEIKCRPLRILEYGPGCNSEQFLNSLVCQHLVSVEDNPEWYDKFAPIFSVADIKTDYQLIKVESPEGKAYCGGHCWTEEEILSYTEYPLRYGTGYFDIIFIDSGDRHDKVTVRGHAYRGFPIRNLSLERAHSLLSESGVAVIHDVPGPYPNMNAALADNIRMFKHVRAFEEFYTTVLSDSLDLTYLERQIRERYRLGFHTRLITRLLNRRGLSWYRSKIAASLVKAHWRLNDSSSPNS